MRLNQEKEACDALKKMMLMSDFESSHLFVVESYAKEHRSRFVLLEVLKGMLQNEFGVSATKQFKVISFSLFI